MTCIFSAGGGLTMRQDQDPGTVEGPEFTSIMTIFSRFYLARSPLSGQSFSGMSTYRGQQAPQAASKRPMVISTRDLRHLRNAANKEQGSVAFPIHRFFSSSFNDPKYQGHGPLELFGVHSAETGSSSRLPRPPPLPGGSIQL